MVEAARNHMKEQIRICNSYVRWKWRQRVTIMMIDDDVVDDDDNDNNNDNNNDC